jgi:hypothetical protein
MPRNFHTFFAVSDTPKGFDTSIHPTTEQLRTLRHRLPDPAEHHVEAAQ